MSRIWVWISLLMVAVLVPAAGAMVTSIPVGPDGSGLDLRSAGATAHLYRVHVGEIVALDVDSRGGQFVRLSVPGFHSSHRNGAPQLPMINRLLAIPAGARARVEILSQTSRLIDLADHGITRPVFPAQPSLSKSADPDKVPFVYDLAAYSAKTVAGPTVQVVRLGSLRSQTIGRLEVAPVEYLPQTNQLRVHDDIEFRVVFDDVDTQADAMAKAATYSPFFKPIYEMIDGAMSSHDGYSDLVGDRVTMVIVTPAEYTAQLADFVAWKTERGFKVILAEIGSAEVGSTTSTIQAYLHGLYTAATPADPAPSFVMFVGDVDQCPTFFLSGDATDRPYCAVDGDLFPEMYYGRLSVANSTQLQAVLHKTMVYDQFTMPDPSYLDTVTLIAGVDGTYAITHGNGQINYGTTQYFNAVQGITANTWLYPASAAAGVNTSILQTINDGIGYINYTAHGNITSWQSPYINQTNINALENEGKYCLVVGNCCLTSSYDYSECFAETFLRAPLKGAIGYIGGSNSTYWNEDYWWGVGYHDAAQIDGTAHPYEETGLGAYDGLFHTHGETVDQHYVTNDALIFCGNLAVTEAGSDREAYYWNIYNLMGDPSLSTYLGIPDSNPVLHDPEFIVGSSVITISAAPGSYAGLTQNGVLLGSGTADAAGDLVLNLDAPLGAGTARLVVMMQNYEPYIADVAVEPGAVWTIEPSVIPIGVPTDVTVTLFESDGVTPIEGVGIWAESLGYITGPILSSESGMVVLSVVAPFGPTLDFVAWRSGDPEAMLREPVEVPAPDLTTPDLSVSTTYGLSDAFPLNLPGVLNVTLGESNPILFAEMSDGGVLTNAGSSLDVIATQLSPVVCTVAVFGYNTYSEIFDVVTAVGGMSGLLTAGGTPFEGAAIRLLDAGLDEVAADLSLVDGSYDLGSDLPVGSYSLVVDHYGFMPYSAPVTINYGANIHDIVLIDAPTGLLTGTVSDEWDASPLGATISVYRSDTSDLIAVTESDPLNGLYDIEDLPYFDYTIVVQAEGHLAGTFNLSIAAAETLFDVELEQTYGTILLIDDTPASKTVPPKYDSEGRLLAEGYESIRPKAATVLLADLDNLGYSVIVETLTGSDPANWSAYDLLISSSGDNTTSLNSAVFRANLLAYVQAGGSLLIEGGEVGYDHYLNGDFATDVLHTTDWNHDKSGALEVHDALHPLMSYPNQISGNNAVTYAGYGDQDAMVPLPDAELVGHWADYPTDAGVITYDPDEMVQGGQIVFFTFCYSSLESGCARSLLENALNWLSPPDDPYNAVKPTPVPRRTALAQNYPNPFNPSTTIAFDLARSGQVELQIFDLAGRLLRTLVDERLPARSHQVQWHGRDDMGRAMASGTYYYRLKADGVVDTRRMVLLK